MGGDGLNAKVNFMILPLQGLNTCNDNVSPKCLPGCFEVRVRSKYTF